MSTTTKKSTYTPRIDSNLKYLILHESPGESKTVNSFLPSGFYAMATIGHFMKTSSTELDIDLETWELNSKADPSKKDVLKNIQTAIDTVRKNNGKVIIASDPDREGEVIGSEIVKYFKLKKGEYIVHGNPTSLVQKEYLKGIEKYRPDLNWDMVESGLGRQALDKYVGWENTSLLWNKSNNYKSYLEGIKNLITTKINTFEQVNKDVVSRVKSVQKIIETFRKLDFDKLDTFENRKGISFGRVQSSGLILLVNKELEKFDKKLEFKLNLQALDSNKLTWEYIDQETPNLSEIHNKLLGGVKQIIVTNITKSTKKVSPPDTLDTLRAQTGLGSTFGYNLDTIMSTLQGLYEGGLTTYMRTDTNSTSEAYEEYIKGMIENYTSQKYIYRSYKVEGSQDGHVGILPTQNYDINNLGTVKKKDGSTLSEDEKNIFDYVVRRTVAAFMPEALIDYWTYTFEVTVSTGEVFKFIIKDSTVVELGFLEVFKYGEDKYQQQVFYKQGDSVNVKEWILREKEIKLPGGYTETSFVSELQKNGIGRPSTWASIVSTLKEKEYIKIKDKKLEVTPKGYWVYQVITQDKGTFGRFSDITFTKQMEEDLDKIATGKATKKQVLDGIRKEVESITGGMTTGGSKGVVDVGEDFGECPSCKKGRVEKKQVSGKTVYGCTNWKGGCKMSLWSPTAGHIFTDDEVKKMMKDKTSDLITDFVSKSGSTFPAKLVFSKTQGFTFEFPPR